MQNGDEVFSHQGKLYYLSGAEYPMENLSDDRELNRVANLSKANGAKVFTHGEDVYQLGPLEKKIKKVSLDEMDTRISLFSTKSVEPLSLESLDDLKQNFIKQLR